MNKLTIIGNLTADPEIRTVKGKDWDLTVCGFTVAVNRRKKSADAEPKTDFFRVSVWGALGEICHSFLSKGRKVYVAGPVTCRVYSDRNGKTRAVQEITAEDVEFLSPREQGKGKSPQDSPIPPALKVLPPDEGDELPF